MFRKGLYRNSEVSAVHLYITKRSVSSIVSASTELVLFPSRVNKRCANKSSSPLSSSIHIIDPKELCLNRESNSDSILSSSQTSRRCITGSTIFPLLIRPAISRTVQLSQLANIRTPAYEIVLNYITSPKCLHAFNIPPSSISSHT